LPNIGFEFKLANLTDAGTFTGVASVYGVEDLGNDVVDPGAFTKTLQIGGSTRPLLWQHRDPIGVVTLTDTGTALAATGKLSLGVAAAKDAYALLKDQAVRGLSIGYQTVLDSFKDGARHLQEVKLWEVSLVTFPMLPSATVTSIKAGRTISAATRQRLGTARGHLANADAVLVGLVDDESDDESVDTAKAAHQAAEQAALLRAIRSFRQELKKL
jgi:hypothetical protein